MADASYQFQRGEPISFGVRVLSGDVAGITVTALLKRAGNAYGAQSAAPAVATFTPSFVAAVGEVAAYWLFTIDPATSAALVPGRYVTDVRFIADGATVQVSSPVWITVNPSVSVS